MKIERERFAFGGHYLSTREKKILMVLVGEKHLNEFTIRVEDHYYYTKFSIFYNMFETFNDLKDYLLYRYYISNDKPEDFLELLKKFKSYPYFDDGCSIGWATRFGHTEIVRNLLDNLRLDISFHGSYSMRWAIKNGNIEIVKLLLSSPSLSLYPLLEFIDNAYDMGRKEIVKLLLTDERIREQLTYLGINKYTNEIS